MKQELLIPPIAEADPNAIEVVRVWVANGGQHVSINVAAWPEPEAWGIVLADLAGHWPTPTNKTQDSSEKIPCGR